MSFVKSLIAFIFGLVALLLFYYFVSIPVIPCSSIYISGMLFRDEKAVLRKLFVSVLSIITIILYGLNTYSMIVYYPQYGNFLAVIFEVLNIIAFIGAWAMNFNIRRNI